MAKTPQESFFLVNCSFYFNFIIKYFYFVDRMIKKKKISHLRGQFEDVQNKKNKRREDNVPILVKI